MGKSRINEALELYSRVAGALNTFFGRWSSGHCANCLELCSSCFPNDPFASMKLVEGTFPGCCQAGVAEDFRVSKFATALPGSFVEAIREQRNALEVDDAGEDGTRFVLADKESGEKKQGVGCRWLGNAGCELGSWKSPLCLLFICKPVRDDLSRKACGETWPHDEDIFYASETFALIGLAFEGDETRMTMALEGVERLEELVNRRSFELMACHGGSH